MSTDKKPTIGMIPAVSIIVGSVLGTGVFFAPSMVARFSTSPWVVALLWGLGALLCFVGSDIYGRLGKTFPCGGGQYVYLKEGWGRQVAFLYGWLSLVVLCPTMIAGMCLYLGSHINYIFPAATALDGKLLAGFTAIFLTWLNLRGIKSAGKFQFFFVSVQILVFVAMAIALFAGPTNVVPPVGFESPEEMGTLKAGILAFAAILWSFEGFNSLTFVTDEIKSGAKRVRRYLFAGSAVVLAIYFLVNFCAIHFLSPMEIANTPNIAIRLNEIGFGAIGKNLTLFLTVVGLITTGHAAILIGPRITEKLASDGYTFKALASRNNKYTSPNNALVLQLALVLGFILFAHFEWMVITFVVINWSFYMLVALSYIRVTPATQVNAVAKANVAIFCVLIFGFIGAQFMQNPILATVGMLWLPAWGISLYLKKRSQSRLAKLPAGYSRIQNKI